MKPDNSKREYYHEKRVAIIKKLLQKNPTTYRLAFIIYRCPTINKQWIKDYYYQIKGDRMVQFLIIMA